MYLFIVLKVCIYFMMIKFIFTLTLSLRGKKISLAQEVSSNTG